MPLSVTYRVITVSFICSSFCVIFMAICQKFAYPFTITTPHTCVHRQMEEKERSQRMEEEVKKKLEEEKKRQEEKEIRKQEEKKQKVIKSCKPIGTSDGVSLVPAGSQRVCRGTTTGTTGAAVPGPGHHLQQGHKGHHAQTQHICP